MTINKYPTWEQTRPHTSVTVNSDALSTATEGSEKALVVFGSAEGGEPGQLYRLNSLPQARDIFIGGDLMDWIELAWSPSTTSEGAGVIYAMRVDNAKQATLKVPGLSITSVQYGEIANQVSVALRQNTTSSNMTLEVINGATGRRESYENLGELFSLSYTGSAAKAATAEVKNGVLTVTVDDTPYASFTLGDNGIYKTIGQLGTAINADENLTATLSIYANKAIETKYMFDKELGNILKTPVTVTSVLGAMVLRTAYSDMINVEGNGKADVEPFTQTQLTGGSNGTVPESWAPLFAKFMEEDAAFAYYLVPLTPDEDIHKELRKFVEEASASGYPLRAIIGGGFEVPFNELRQRRANIASPRISMVGFSSNVRMSDGRLLLAPPYMSTAFVGGIASGLPNGEPVTFKNIRVESLATFSTPYTSDELDILYDEGIITAEKSRNRANSTFRISSDVTTTNETEDAVSRSMALGEVTDFLGNGLRIELDDTFIGSRTTLATASDIKTAVSQYLGIAQNNGEIVDYDPADISVVVIGDQAQVNFSVVPTRSLNTIKVGISYRNEAIVTQ